jgi:hypothetical protein
VVAVVSVELELELPEDPLLPELLDPLLPELPLEELPLPELPLPEPPDVDPPLDELPEVPDDPDAEESVAAAAGAARYITVRTSISIFRNNDRASRARSTSSWPEVEYRQYILRPA